jgi:hypothetical protein
MDAIDSYSPVIHIKPVRAMTTTIVRRSVAKLEFISLTPSFANMAVAAANIAARTAQNCQLEVITRIYFPNQQRVDSSLKASLSQKPPFFALTHRWVSKALPDQNKDKEPNVSA